MTQSTHAFVETSDLIPPRSPMRDRLVMTSVRLDHSLHQALRQIAYNRRVSMHSLLLEGARAVQQRYENQDS
jgi:hypothetical protein